MIRMRTKSIVTLTLLMISLILVSQAQSKPPQCPMPSQGPQVRDDDCGCLTTKSCTCTVGNCECWDGGPCPLVKSAKVTKTCICSGECTCGCNQGGRCICSQRTQSLPSQAYSQVYTSYQGVQCENGACNVPTGGYGVGSPLSLSGSVPGASYTVQGAYSGGGQGYSFPRLGGSLRGRMSSRGCSSGG